MTDEQDLSEMFATVARELLAEDDVTTRRMPGSGMREPDTAGARPRKPAA